LYFAFIELRKQLILLEKAVQDKDTKSCRVVARNYKRIREELSLKDVGLIFDYYIPDLASKLNIPRYDPDLFKINFEEKLYCTQERAKTLASSIEAK